MLGLAGAAISTACSGDTPTSASPVLAATPSPTPTPGSTATCVVSPTETIGPYPSLDDFVRSDIREGRPGLPVTLTVKVVNVSNSCAPIAGAVVDIWQCDATGNYSQYGSQRTLTYLRGIQTTDDNGQSTFTTIYPG
jgi:protocatechuate 3,4-dioxygenase beta subunit